MEFGKDFQLEQGGLVDDEQRLLFFSTDQGVDLLTDEPGEDRPGRRDRVHVEFCQQLPIDLEDGAVRLPSAGRWIPCADLAVKAQNAADFVLDKVGNIGNQEESLPAAA